jgi:hypothetical protein
VIANKVTVIGCRPARIGRRSTVASPCRTKASSVAFLKPCASNPGQALALLLFLPVWPRIGTDDPAPGGLCLGHPGFIPFAAAVAPMIPMSVPLDTSA